MKRSTPNWGKPAPAPVGTEKNDYWASVTQSGKLEISSMGRLSAVLEMKNEQFLEDGSETSV